MTTTEKRTAYIFEDVGGWFVCDDADSMLDARGRRYESKREAIAWLRGLLESGHETYTHYRTGGTKPRKL